MIVNPNKILVLNNGVRIPYGKKIKNSSSGYGFSEYVVYDPAQIRIRYVIQVKMIFLFFYFIN